MTLELAEIADLPLINTDLEEDVGGGETRCAQLNMCQGTYM